MELRRSLLRRSVTSNYRRISGAGVQITFQTDELAELIAVARQDRISVVFGSLLTNNRYAGKTTLSGVSVIDPPGGKGARYT